MLTAAVATSARVMASPAMKVTWRSARGRRGERETSGSAIADARVEDAVENVHRRVHRDDHRGHEEHDALHHRQVAGADGGQGEPAQTGEIEDRLQDDAAGEELA